MVFFVFAPQKQAHHMIFLGHLFWEIMEQKKAQMVTTMLNIALVLPVFSSCTTLLLEDL